MSSLAFGGTGDVAAQEEVAAQENDDSSENLIDFEDVQADEFGRARLGDRYGRFGVRFGDDDVALDTTIVFERSGLGASGRIVISDCTETSSCTNRIDISFARPQRSVSISVGHIGALANPELVLFEGFDASGQPVGSDITAIAAGDISIPATRVLTVDDPAGGIRAVRLGWDAGEPAELVGLIADDLRFVPAAARARFRPEVVSLDDSVDGAPKARVALVNVGNVVIDVAGVEVEGDEPFVVDDSACRGVLEPGTRCPVDVEVAGDAPAGETRSLLVAVDGRSRPLAEAEVLVVVAEVAGGPVTTVGGRPGADTEEPGDAVPEPDGPSGVSGAGTDGPADVVAGAIGLAVLALIVGVPCWLILRSVRGRSRRSRRRERRPSPSSKPRVKVRHDPGVQQVLGDGRPVVSITASVATAEFAAVEGDVSRPDGAGSTHDPSPEGT